MLVLELGKEWVIGIHLKMSGQLILVKSAKLKVQSYKPEFRTTEEKSIEPANKYQADQNNKHLRVVINFTDGDILLFIDQRIFGWVKIMKREELRRMNYVKNLGPEPWDITDDEFLTRFKTGNRPIKLVILDQEIISGVGNIYANDSLWEARIKPSRKAKSLKKSEAVSLRTALIKVLKEGIKYGGSTGQDGKYIDLMGNTGSYQEHFRVYDRKGEKCSRGDGGVIQKIALGGRGTYFCPVCQK
jgi:formamidopyrimidine-DNA glycosylase